MTSYNENPHSSMRKKPQRNGQQLYIFIRKIESFSFTEDMLIAARYYFKSRTKLNQLLEISFEELLLVLKSVNIPALSMVICFYYTLIITALYLRIFYHLSVHIS